MKRDTPLSATPNPAPYSGGLANRILGRKVTKTTSTNEDGSTTETKRVTGLLGRNVQKVKRTDAEGNVTKEKEVRSRNLTGGQVFKTKEIKKRADNDKDFEYRYKSKGSDIKGGGSFQKTKLNREIPEVSDMTDLRKGKSKTILSGKRANESTIPTSRKQKDADLKVGYGDTGLMAKTQNYSKENAKSVLKAVGSAVKRAVSRNK